MTTLIKNGTIITAAETYQADILVEKEIIRLIGKTCPPRPEAWSSTRQANS